MKTKLHIAGLPIAAVAALAIVLESAPVLAGGEEDSISGVWLTEKSESKIRMYKCGENFCGTLVWINPQKDPEALDVSNPDPAKRSRKLLGLTLFWNLKFNPKDNVYDGGSVYDPRRGKVFRCKAWIENGGKILKLRGFFGVSLFGETVTWERVK
jgi:uncharacterized protein (DUF2147 family)